MTEKRYLRIDRQAFNKRLNRLMDLAILRHLCALDHDAEGIQQHTLEILEQKRILLESMEARP